ncbi:MAG: c-type cytochrome [Longimicrobiales bacterium]
MKAVIRTFGACALAAAAIGCGDPATSDDRGYTKAPLEHPTVLIDGEEPTAMAMLREPLTTPVREVPVPAPTDTTAAAADSPAADAAQVPLPEGVTAAMVTAGEQVFTGPGFCFTCHGQGGAGSPLAPPLNDNEWLHIDGAYEAIVETVRTGVPEPMQFPTPMPPMGGAQLSDDQIRAVAAYVYTISR